MPAKVNLAKKRNPRNRKLSAEDISKHNLSVARRREKELRDFGLELKPGILPLEPSVRKVSIKFTRLPFGFITDSCGGHFSKEKAVSALNEIPFKKLRPSKNVFFGGANFELTLDYSLEAMKFRTALKKITEKLSFVEYRRNGNQIEFGILKLYNPKTMEEFQEVRVANRAFIKEFEKVVDSFVKRYGIGRDKLKKP